MAETQAPLWYKHDMLLRTLPCRHESTQPLYDDVAPSGAARKTLQFIPRDPAERCSVCRAIVTGVELECPAHFHMLKATHV